MKAMAGLVALLARSSGGGSGRARTAGGTASGIAGRQRSSADMSPPPKQPSRKPKAKASKHRAKLEFVMEFHVQRRAAFWVTSVYLPLLAMELIVPMAFALPVQVLQQGGGGNEAMGD